MTWQTESGDRYLIGAEARVFRAALRSSVEQLELHGLDCSHTLLARQTRKARLHLLAFVGKHLLRPTEVVAPLNAWTEGAVGIVFRRLEAEVEIEIDMDEGDEDEETTIDSMRKLIYNAVDEETREAASDTPFDHRCDDFSTWQFLVEHLRDRILWDTDWEVDDDRSPEDVKETMGIDAEYFEWSQVLFRSNKEAIRLLGKLCGFRCGESEGEVIA